MNKPTKEQIDAAYAAYKNKYKDKARDKDFIDAIIKQWWYTIEDFWNPEFDNNWNFIIEDVNTESKGVSEEWKGVPASSEKETPSESKKDSDIKLNSFSSDKNNDASDEKWESKFINAANEDWWEFMTWQEKLETLVEEYNDIINQARNYVHDKSSWYGLSWKWAEQFNEKLKSYKDKLSTIENSKEFEQLMKDIEKDWTGKLFDNGIMNTNVNQTLKLIASWAWSKMFNNKDRLWNWLDSYATSWINKVAWALNDTPGGIAKTITHIPWVWRIIWPAISVIAWEDAQDIAKKYLKWEYKSKDTKKESKDTKDTKKDTNTVKSKNTSDTKWVKDWKPNPSNWKPSDETPINWVEEDNYIYDKNGNPVWSKNLNIKKK